MYVCLYEFSSVDTAGGCTNFSRNEIKETGEQLRSIYPIYSSWGAEKDKTPNYGQCQQMAVSTGC